MAVMTDDTFDALRRYVGVRLQQGVPIADSDWNEIDDVHEFGLRAPTKWFVGDGVPEGTNGFRIEGTGLTNDFFIGSGITGMVNGLSNIGRYLADGLNVTISADVRFTGQQLHIGQPGALALALALGVPPIQAIGSVWSPSKRARVWPRPASGPRPALACGESRWSGSGAAVPCPPVAILTRCPATPILPSPRSPGATPSSMRMT